MGALTYNPSEDGIVLAKPVGALYYAVDARSTYYDSDYFVRRQFQSLAFVKTYFANPEFRKGWFTIYVNETGTLNVSTGLIDGGTTKEYWWRDNLTDGGLVEKKSDLTDYATLVYVNDQIEIVQEQVDELTADLIQEIEDRQTGDEVNAAAIAATNAVVATKVDKEDQFSEFTIVYADLDPSTHTLYTNLSLAGKTVNVDTIVAGGYGSILQNVTFDEDGVLNLSSLLPDANFNALVRGEVGLLNKYINKTSDITLSVSPNLFNKASYREDVGLGTGGLLIPIDGAACTDNIYIEEGQTHISFSGIDNILPTKIIGYYNETDVYLGYQEYSTLEGTFEIPYPTASYFIFYFSRAVTQAKLDALMLNWGETPLEYVPYYPPTIETITGLPILAQRVDGNAIILETGESDESVINRKDLNDRTNYGYSVAGVNLADPDAIIDGYEFNGNSDAVIPQPLDSIIWVKVKSNSAYYISGLPTGATVGRYRAFYLSDKTTYITGSKSFIPNTTLETSIASPPTAEWMVFNLRGRSTNTDFSILMINEGATKIDFVPYEPGVSSINGNPIISVNGGGSDPTEPYIKPTKDKVALLFGDSITETLTSGGSERSNWPIFMNPILEWASYSNYARSGASYKDDVTHTDPRQDMSVQIQDAIADGNTPDIIVMACGTNDGLALTGDYATAMAKTTLASLDKTLFWEAIRWCYWTIRTEWPNATCYSVLPIQRASSETATLQPLYDAIEKMAKRYNFKVIDGTYESGIIRDTEAVGVEGTYLYDGLHPNVFGQQLMANLIGTKILSSYI